MSESQPESPKTREFRNVEGRASRVQILSSTQIGEGGRGRIYRVQATIEGETGKEPHSFILKEYKTPDKNVVEHAVLMHGLLKEQKVDTWTTFRYNQEDQTILMTDGELASDDILFGRTTSKSKERLVPRRIESVGNFEEALTKGIAHALSAAEAFINIPNDAWFSRLTLANEGTNAEVHWLVGDFDNVGYAYDPAMDPDKSAYLKNTIALNNLATFTGAVYDVLEPYVAQLPGRTYEALLLRKVQEAREAVVARAKI